VKQVLEKYKVVVDFVEAEIKIIKNDEDFVDEYHVTLPEFPEATKEVIDEIREKLISGIKLYTGEILDPRKKTKLKQRVIENALRIINEKFRDMPELKRKALAGMIAHQMVGLGEIEIMLADDNLEDITINSASEPIWVFHRSYGWLKSNIKLESEEKTRNYASSIAREVLREITLLNPLLDAQMLSGDRVNATLYPISVFGNTMSIRKFRRRPWTIVNFISPKFNTLSSELAALIWQAIQYGASLLVTGGTATGKTSMLNTLMLFVPPNERIISIEETREIALPKFFQWVALVTRSPNPEGKGGISMHDLLVNALRMRPDRIIVGEVRRPEEVEVMFEAIHVGHPCYATIHADTAIQVQRRLMNPPFNLSTTMMEALQAILVMYRDRRKEIRRVLEFVEVIPAGSIENPTIELSTIYKWDPKVDTQIQITPMRRLREEIKLHTGMSDDEMRKDQKEKQTVLEYCLKHNISGINEFARVIANYYRNREKLLEIVRKDLDPKKILGK